MRIFGLKNDYSRSYNTIRCFKMSEAYHQFMAIEKQKLREMYPHFSSKTISSMARDLWKANKGCGSGITARNGTLKYEVNKGLIERVPQHDMSQYPEIRAVVTRKECVYCTRPVRSVSKKKGDHIFAVQADSTKPILTNFSAFTMPCCTDCNNSRGNKPLMEFVLSDEKYQNNMEFFHKTMEIVKENVEYYEADQGMYVKINEFIQYATAHIRHLTQNVPITYIGAKLSSDIYETGPSDSVSL